MTWQTKAKDKPLPEAVRAAIVGRIDDESSLEAMVVTIDGTVDRPDGSTFHITWKTFDLLNLPRGCNGRLERGALSFNYISEAGCSGTGAVAGALPFGATSDRYCWSHSVLSFEIRVSQVNRAVAISVGLTEAAEASTLQSASFFRPQARWSINSCCLVELGTDLQTALIVWDANWFSVLAKPNAACRLSSWAAV